MPELDRLIPTPRLLEVESVTLSAPCDSVWNHLRNGDLGESPLVRALFDLRTWPSRALGHVPEKKAILRLSDLKSTVEQPGFQILAEEPGKSLTIGAIGQVWHLDIPFHHVGGPDAYASFNAAGWVKVAWEIRLEPESTGCRLELEVRVDATDSTSWTKFSRYWILIGPGSHFIRHVLLSDLKRRFGSPKADDEKASLPGDELLSDASAQVTHSITIMAPQEAVWPWLVQMGCSRAGFYSIDLIDNGGQPSAHEIHPDWQAVHVGQVFPAAPGSSEGFEVLAIEPEKSLVLGGLFDVRGNRQLPFRSARPEDYWHVTWSFVLEPESATSTRLHVRARAAFSPSETFHVRWIRPAHSLMQTTQLRNLKARAENQLPLNTWADVGDGILGAVLILASAANPFGRAARSHWGLTEEEAARPRPGDELIPNPLWSWTHAVEIPTSAEKVWPWLAQIGADRAGFYSYQWLENLAGTNLRNAETVHPNWAHQVGDKLVLHPKIPPIPVVAVEPNRLLLAFAPPDEEARREGRPFAAASWAFLLEPLADGHCRLVSRFRTSCSNDLLTRLAQGPALLEPIGFAMDRRMLLGIRERVFSATKA
jgi:hypothetical protein